MKDEGFFLALLAAILFANPNDDASIETQIDRAEAILAELKKRGYSDD